MTAVVTVSPPGDLSGLTRRELEILGMLIDGWSDQRVAAALNLPLLKVAETVERIAAKFAADTRLLATVRAARRGLYIPALLATRLADQVGNTVDARDGLTTRRPAVCGLPRLTVRETEVAELIADGFTNRQIAQMLLIGRRTVESHVEHILQKLAFRSRTQVAAWVARQARP